jgi:hypothetical protein
VPDDGKVEVWVLGLGTAWYEREEVARARKVPVVGPELCYPDKQANMPPGSWILAKPDMSERPRTGDTPIFVTGSDFKHMNLFKESYKQPKADGSGEEEIWVTADGGQGTPGRYYDDEEYKKAHGTPHGGTKLTTKGKEAIMRKEAVYDPSANTVGGSKLLGWVNIEKMVEDGPVSV